MDSKVLGRQDSFWDRFIIVSRWESHVIACVRVNAEFIPSEWIQGMSYTIIKLKIQLSQALQTSDMHL